ncbi:hypothetical protein [Jannaschia sp. W003]|uniref:hypothetical protein n=1 Tax=Jannaschia sp. W003 TaxID=2867012 RepID=UPI0021A55137|nr:hypothetical protein [Jannaschia sp. W003]UWQ23114.1 hypothetical protein K3554_16255 [Jannaschia sp. W003]
MTAIKFVGSGAVIGGAIASTAAFFWQEHWEQDRERREALESLIVTWHSDYIGQHRDRVSLFLLEPAGVEMRSRPPAEYGGRLTAAFARAPELVLSVSIIASFYRSVDFCIRDKRCDAERTLAAFSPSAREFHRAFAPQLRLMDCELRYDGVEDHVLAIARLEKPLPSFPQRCGS